MYILMDNPPRPRMNRKCPPRWFTTGAAVLVKAPSGKGKIKPFAFSSNYLNPANKNMNHD